jgi:hypothetical protein
VIVLLGVAAMGAVGAAILVYTTVEVKETIFLRDPDFKVPFRIAYEGTDARYLTGADFDTRKHPGAERRHGLDRRRVRSLHDPGNA